MVEVAGDGSKRILIGVLAQVRKRREVGWNKTTTVTSADEGAIDHVQDCARLTLLTIFHIEHGRSSEKGL